MRDLTPSQRFFNGFLFFWKKKQPMLRPSYHTEQTLYSSAPACSYWNSPQDLPGTFPHRLSSWTQCHSCHGAKTGETPAPLTQQCGEHAVFFAHGVYCSWQRSVRSLSGGTLLFTIFPQSIWKLCEWARCQGSHVACEAASVSWSLFRGTFCSLGCFQSWRIGD